MNAIKLNAEKLGFSAGIVGAILVFFSTISGILGYSNSAEVLSSSFWGMLGYSVSWAGAFIGILLGFIYAFVLVWVTAKLYNKLIN